MPLWSLTQIFSSKKTSATFREILDAMWLFNDKFEQALSKFDQTHNRRENQLPR
jgi:hypothetical protein